MYTGVTNNIKRRCTEHKNGIVDGFTKRYRVNKLVYFERFNDVRYAIAREKAIIGLLRSKKNELVNSLNPEWKDLYELL